MDQYWNSMNEMLGDLKYRLSFHILHKCACKMLELLSFFFHQGRNDYLPQNWTLQGWFNYNKYFIPYTGRGHIYRDKYYETNLEVIEALYIIIPWKIDQSLCIMENMICMWIYLDKSPITCIFVSYIFDIVVLFF